VLLSSAFDAVDISGNGIASLIYSAQIGSTRESAIYHATATGWTHDSTDALPTSLQNNTKQSPVAYGPISTMMVVLT